MIQLAQNCAFHHSVERFDANCYPRVSILVKAYKIQVLWCLWSNVAISVTASLQTICQFLVVNYVYSCYIRFLHKNFVGELKAILKLKLQVVGKPGPTVKRISGLSILDNNAVNFVSVLLTTVLTSMACSFIFWIWGTNGTACPQNKGHFLRF